MSRAMQPVLVTVLIFKFIIIISTDIVFYISSFGNYAVGYNEALYLLVSHDDFYFFWAEEVLLLKNIFKHT